jgi:hypothetical protein
MAWFGIGRSLEQSFNLIEVRGDFHEILSLIKVVWCEIRRPNVATLSTVARPQRVDKREISEISAEGD